MFTHAIVQLQTPQQKRERKNPGLQCSNPTHPLDYSNFGFPLPRDVCGLGGTEDMRQAVVPGGGVVCEGQLSAYLERRVWPHVRPPPPSTLAAQEPAGRLRRRPRSLYLLIVAKTCVIRLWLVPLTWTGDGQEKKCVIYINPETGFVKMFGGSLGKKLKTATDSWGAHESHVQYVQDPLEKFIADNVDKKYRGLHPTPLCGSLKAVSRAASCWPSTCGPTTLRATTTPSWTRSPRASASRTASCVRSSTRCWVDHKEARN